MYKAKFNIIKSEPVEKHYKDIKKYDVTRFEYGDFDNWVTAILLDVKLEKSPYNPNDYRVSIHFCYQNGEEETCYDMSRTKDYKMEIIGHAVEIEPTNINSL